MKVLIRIDRTTGRARPFVLDNMNKNMSKNEIMPILRKNIAKEARVMTDEVAWYKLIGNDVLKYETVDHALGEW